MENLQDNKNRVVGAMLLGLYTLLLHWNTLPLPLIRDEGEYAYAAWGWGQGLMPYSDAVLQKPPMVIYTYASVAWLDDGTGIVFRILAVIFAWVGALVLGDIAARKIGPAARWPARLLLPAVMLMPHMSQALANTEQFMILPILLTWWLSVYGGPGAPWRTWFAAGCFAGAAVMYKYTAAAPVAVIIAFWLGESYALKRETSLVVVRAAGVAAGAAAVILLATGPFLLHDGGRALYECTLAFNREYVKAHLVANFTFRHLTGMAGWWFGLVLLALWWAAPRVKKEPFLLTLFLVCLFGTTLSPYEQYYVILLPPLVFAAAGGCVKLAEWLEKHQGISLRKAQGVVAALAVVCALLPNIQWLIQPPSTLQNTLGWALLFRDTSQVAGKIDSLSAPGDLVLMAGSEPQVLYLARRKSAMRFITVYPLMLPTRFAQGYQEQAIQQIRANRPRVVVVVRDLTSWLPNASMPLLFHNNLEAMLKSDYDLASTLCWTDQGMVWLDDPGAATHPAAAWIVFTRKGSPAPDSP